MNKPPTKKIPQWMKDTGQQNPYRRGGRVRHRRSSGGGLGDFFSSIGRGIKHAAETVGGGIKHAAEKVGSGVKHVAGKIGQGVTHAAKTVGGGIKHAAETVGHGVKGAAETVGRGVKGTAETVGRGIKGAAETVGHGVKNVAETVGHGIKGAAETVGRGIKDTATTSGEWIKDHSDDIESIAKQVVGSVPVLGPAVERAWTGIEGAIKSGNWEDAAKILTNTFSPIVGVARSLAEGKNAEALETTLGATKTGLSMIPGVGQGIGAAWDVAEMGINQAKEAQEAAKAEEEQKNLGAADEQKKAGKIKDFVQKISQDAGLQKELQSNDPNVINGAYQKIGGMLDQHFSDLTHSPLSESEIDNIFSQFNQGTNQQEQAPPIPPQAPIVQQVLPEVQVPPQEPLPAPEQIPLGPQESQPIPQWMTEQGGQFSRTPEAQTNNQIPEWMTAQGPQGEQFQGEPNQPIPEWMTAQAGQNPYARGGAVYPQHYGLGGLVAKGATIAARAAAKAAPSATRAIAKAAPAAARAASKAAARASSRAAGAAARSTAKISTQAGKMAARTLPAVKRTPMQTIGRGLKGTARAAGKVASHPLTQAVVNAGSMVPFMIPLMQKQQPQPEQTIQNYYQSPPQWTQPPQEQYQEQPQYEEPQYEEQYQEPEQYDQGYQDQGQYQQSYYEPQYEQPVPQYEQPQWMQAPQEGSYY